MEKHTTTYPQTDYSGAYALLAGYFATAVVAFVIAEIGRVIYPDAIHSYEQLSTIFSWLHWPSVIAGLLVTLIVYLRLRSRT